MNTDISPLLTEEKRDLFMTKVKKSEGCWEWLAGKMRRGYGGFFLRGKTLKAHRVSFHIHVGPIPRGLHVLHRCDNPSCVNPEHLFTGTNFDNMQDMARKGRQRTGPYTKERMSKLPRGEQNHHAKLNETAVKEIRRRYDLGESSTAIGLDFGVTHAAVRKVGIRQTWAHVK